MKGISKVVRDIIVGKDNYIETYCEYKQAMLSGQYGLIGILVILFYIAYSLINGDVNALIVFIPALSILLLSVYLHRQGQHCRANYFLLPTVNIAVYLLSASESPNTGAMVMFIPATLAAFSVFGFKRRDLSLLFVAFTFILFSLAYFFEFSILPVRYYSESETILSSVVNFTTALITSVMAVYLLIEINHHNAMELVTKNKQLQKTNTELDRFVYSTSHDLRAPLASLLGLINITRESENPSEVKNYLIMMKDRVSHLDKFIRDITDYSRNNRLGVEKKKVNLHSMANEIWDNLKYSSDALGITFEVDIPESLVIETDPNRLKIVLSNLISNSIRYHDTGKSEKFIRLKHQKNGSVFYLKVEDNGQGISPEYQTKIFDMFFRANEHSSGSGLGLYIVKETIANLSGSIHLDSAPKVGSTFTVRLPAGKIAVEA